LDIGRERKDPSTVVVVNMQKSMMRIASAPFASWSCGVGFINDFKVVEWVEALSEMGRHQFRQRSITMMYALLSWHHSGLRNAYHFCRMSDCAHPSATIPVLTDGCAVWQAWHRCCI